MLRKFAICIIINCFVFLPLCFAKQNYTPCANAIFAQALADNANKVNDNTPEHVVKQWIKDCFHNPEIIKQILNCPEVSTVEEYETITFDPIIYTFSNGREVTINYETQPKLLKQHLMLAGKRSLPNDEDNPEIGVPGDPTIWINTDPAWYGLLVVQHNSLSEFVGSDKNNTVSLQYIDQHIKDIYPKGHYCTSKTAIANDKDRINKAGVKTVGLQETTGEKDTNDYYIAGDADLGWVMYAEIALDIAITVLTAGIGELGMIQLKGLRASKIAKQLTKNLREIEKIPEVKKYISQIRKVQKTEREIAKIESNAKYAKEYEKITKQIDKVRKSGGDITKYEKEKERILKEAKQIDSNVTEDVLKNISKDPEQLKKQKSTLEETLATDKEIAATQAKNSKDVGKYLENKEQLENMIKYVSKIRAFKRARTGNVSTKPLKMMKGAYKTLKAAETGARKMNTAAKVARAGMSSKSAKIGDYLFSSTLKHGARFSKYYRNLGIIYGAVSIIGDMYDYTTNENQEFTNGIKFKPLGLLSADDIAGQENVVNYGMWLMWIGDSTNPEDDDAAYLQAMDFAGKFHYNLEEIQEETSAECNVDIYVVRPIIRLDESNSTEEPAGDLFYLIMNDIPWTTAEQFGEQHQDIEDWERVQTDLQQNSNKNNGSSSVDINSSPDV